LTLHSSTICFPCSPRLRKAWVFSHACSVEGIRLTLRALQSVSATYRLGADEADISAIVLLDRLLLDLLRHVSSGRESPPACHLREGVPKAGLAAALRAATRERQWAGLTGACVCMCAGGNSKRSELTLGVLHIRKHLLHLSPRQPRHPYTLPSPRICVGAHSLRLDGSQGSLHQPSCSC